PGRAPSGLLLDVAKIESVEPVARRAEPQIPPVVTNVPSPSPVHRKVVEHAPRPGLMTSDIEIAFPDAPPTREPEPELGVAIAWSAEDGFTQTGSPSRMRLVGQREAFEDAAGLVGEHDDTDSGGPSLRYLPAPGPRREQAPRDLVDIVEEATGVRVSDALIDRSPETSDRAASIGAIAFTERATVHMPAELGELSETHNRAIVAHELTHVAQQRTIGRVPAEDSPEGRELEGEARQVQRRVGGTVRPHFLRRRTGPLEAAAGVQRLANDESPYAWQERGPAPSEDRVLEAFGFRAAAGGAIEQRREREDEAWARGFETENATRLHAMRERHYFELKDEVLREKRIVALREDEDPPTDLTRREAIHLRQELDDEWPWEFGAPENLRFYPEELPPEAEGEGEAAPVAHAGGAAARHAAGAAAAHSARAPGSTAGARHLRATTGHTTGAGARPGAGRGRGQAPGAHAGGRGGAEGSQFEWQERESTDQETVQALFGGGLFGGLLGLAVGPESDADRASAEASTPRLHERRQDKERELRHRVLQSKLADHRRNDTLADVRDNPIRLSHDEIVQIREQVDNEMPLQYVTPEYLEQHMDAQISADGDISRAAELAPDEAGGQPAPGGGVAAGAPAATGATTTATADSTAAVAAALTRAPAEQPADDEAGEGQAVGAGARGPGLLRTGLAAGLGAYVGNRLAAHSEHIEPPGEHEHAHYDSFGEDEEAAGRIFAAASEVDIDVLSRRLWSRIRRELRTELLVDRERAGSLADIR
ncbi:MAG TPA: DUF4157 domain-containing protein, partial [Ilumatobacter sp.]|nr:DUF4157 domain-containing protein [Ilumatobacter sp.]